MFNVKFRQAPCYFTYMKQNVSYCDMICDKSNSLFGNKVVNGQNNIIKL